MVWGVVWGVVWGDIVTSRIDRACPDEPELSSLLNITHSI